MSTFPQLAQVVLDTTDARLRETTWPDDEIPQQMHPGIIVAGTALSRARHRRGHGGTGSPARARPAPGVTVRDDRSEDENEPLRVYADPAGHRFCVSVGSAGPLRRASAMRVAASRSWPGECAA
jgi:hypothetical protein